ncbi:MAG: hypothetical protein QOK23_924 [Gammaproteobacteria bacterium]|nr:hypothetical protein [Gammaproteobacteria bacterium]
MSLHRPPFFDPLRFVSFVGSKKTRQEAIAEIAYFRAMKRGFTPGHELEDWIEAEAEFYKGQGQAWPGRTAQGRDRPGYEKPSHERPSHERPGHEGRGQEVATR